MKLNQLKKIIREELKNLNEQRGSAGGRPMGGKPTGGQMMGKPHPSWAGADMPDPNSRSFWDWLCRTFGGGGCFDSHVTYGNPCRPCPPRDTQANLEE